VKVWRGDPRTWGPPPEDGSAVTIGVYDGVHRGHQAVLADLAERAAQLGVDQQVVLTFDRHPLALVDPGSAPRNLTSIGQRIEILDSMGVDAVGILPFDQIRTMHPTAFIHQVLLGSMGAKLVVVGTNFRFGRNRAGDVAGLGAEGLHHGFEVDAVELLRGDGSTVSSSVIRALLEAGDVEAAEEALGRPFELRSTVIPGDGRGHSIGYPTANLSVPGGMAIPRRGVYVARVTIGQREIPGVVNVGIRPTFGGGSLMIEVHLIGLNEDLYGRPVAVRFRHRLRDERKFGSVAELVAQIERDVEAARRFLQERQDE
jgi:riboflavin kinase/FMN adenylyltransferase